MNNEIFNQHDQMVLRKNLRTSLTKGEAILWNKLKGSQLNWKFRRQHGIDKYITDFYCQKLKLADVFYNLTGVIEKIKKICQELGKNN